MAGHTKIVIDHDRGKATMQRDGIYEGGDATITICGQPCKVHFWSLGEKHTVKIPKLSRRKPRRPS